jgi:hypothetical protein
LIGIAVRLEMRPLVFIADGLIGEGQMVRFDNSTSLRESQSIGASEKIKHSLHGSGC